MSSTSGLKACVRHRCQPGVRATPTRALLPHLELVPGLPRIQRPVYLLLERVLHRTRCEHLNKSCIQTKRQQQTCLAPVPALGVFALAADQVQHLAGLVRAVEQDARICRPAQSIQVCLLLATRRKPSDSVAPAYELQACRQGGGATPAQQRDELVTRNAPMGAPMLIWEYTCSPDGAISSECTVAAARPLCTRTHTYTHVRRCMQYHSRRCT